MSFSYLPHKSAACFFLLLVVCSVPVMLAAQTDAANKAATDQTASSVSQTPGAATSHLLLGVGDLVEMTVYNVPELATKTRISSDGNMYCPLIGYMHVAGLSTEEAQALIEKRLEEFVKNPHVALFVSEYASQGVSVLGEVAKPGVYPVLGQQHLFALLSAAGGLTEKSGRSLSVTHRSDPDHPVTVELPRKLTDDAQTNVPVFPGDTVIVGKADIVYVVGDVLRPSGLLMDSGGLTVLQALALAGGSTHTAKLNGAKLLRKDPHGTTETTVDIKKMLQAKTADVALQPNDILIVPSNTGKILAGRTLEAALQAATLISVAAIP